jgi:integrase
MQKCSVSAGLVVVAVKKAVQFPHKNAMKIFTKPYKPARISEGKSEWYVYYSYLNPTTGKWQMFKDRAGLNYADMSTRERRGFAEATRDAYNERLKAGWSPFGEESVTTEEYENLKFTPGIKVLQELHKAKKNTVKKRTWDSYKYSINALEKWLKKNNLQHLMLSAITAKHLTLFFDSLAAKGDKGKSINSQASNLHTIFGMAVKRELITKNPVAGYEKLPEESGKHFPFSEKQKQDLKKKILEKDPSLWLFVKGIYHLFIRPVELLRLKIADVDLRTSQVIVHSGAGKNKKQWAVQIPDSFIKEIKALKLEQYPPDWYLFGQIREKVQGQKITIGPSPKAYGRNSVSDRHTAILRACGITNPDYTMYGWKHTGNIDSFLAGVTIYDLSRQNRHSSIQQTMTYLRSLGLSPNVEYGRKAPKL